jgi:preprotein translocase subunit SecE
MADEVKVSKIAEKRKTFVKFYKEVRSELKKVIWPNRTQLTNNTITVLGACAVIGLLIWGSDQVFERLVDLFLGKLL